MLPTVNVVKARGWPSDGKPIAADGLTVAPFARGLDHPRWVYVLPNGDVLVAETNAPRAPTTTRGSKAGSSTAFQKKAGSGVPSPNRITLRRDGAFYGWPYCYYAPTYVDARVKPPRPDLVATAVAPHYALGPHTASLGLAYVSGGRLPARFTTGMVVGQHGSWNRKPRSGYKVIFVPFRDGRPSGAAVDVLTGFVQDNGDAMGRPVGVAFAADGALLVADDVGSTVWRVTGAAAAPRRSELP